MLVKENTRELARLVEVLEIKPILKADKLEIAVIGGWECVVSKGLYKVGDTALYLEIDSAIPADSPVLANFDKTHLRIVNKLSGVKQASRDSQEEQYAIIKTLRLRGALSQGLLLARKNYEHLEFANAPVGTNLTSQLGVLKYVSPEEASLYAVDGVTEERDGSATRKLVWTISAKLMKGIVANGFQPFPVGIRKSDQPRAQNITEKIRKWREAGHTAEYTIKLNGESVTYYTDLTTGVVGVAQRNFSLRLDDVPYTRSQSLRVYLADVLRYTARKLAGARVSSPRWKKGYVAQSNPAVALFFRDQIGNRIGFLNTELAGARPPFDFAAGMTISVQGEALGPDFNKNAENTPKNDFFAYTVYGNGLHIFSPEQARAIVKYLGMNYVPVMDAKAVLPETIKELLKLADGEAYFDKQRRREGFVGKSNETNLSFKVISNAWLEKKDK